MVFLSDGGDSVRNLLQAYLHPDQRALAGLVSHHHADQLAAAAGENFEGRTAGGTRGGITPRRT